MNASAIAYREERRTAMAGPLDPLMLAVVLALLTISVVMVASVTTEISYRSYGTPFHLFIRHAIYLGVGLALSVAALFTPVRVWQRIDWVLLLCAFILLVAVLIPGVGTEVNGAVRWISLGAFTLQGSELVKLFLVVYMSGYLVRRRAELMEAFSGFGKPCLLLIAVSLLLLMQPDFGAVVVITAAVFGMFFLAGVPLRQFLPVISLSALAISAIAVWQPYRLQRLIAFADPWEHQFSSGYQLTQALIAFGRGEWTGLGLGNSIQKLFFLPEAHTDFVFSIIAEELGAAGALLVIALFAALIWRALVIGRRACADACTFPGLLAFGIALTLGSQAFINVGVNIGLLPTKGLTLPFISYGGNSVIVSMVMAAILLRIDYETRFAARDTARTAGGGRRSRG